MFHQDAAALDWFKSPPLEENVTLLSWLSPFTSTTHFSFSFSFFLHHYTFLGGLRPFLSSSQIPSFKIPVAHHRKIKGVYEPLGTKLGFMLLDSGFKFYFKVHHLKSLIFFREFLGYWRHHKTSDHCFLNCSSARDVFEGFLWEQ